MVKKSETKSGPRRGPMPDTNADGSPRGKPGVAADPAAAKSDRIIMRVHPDLLSIIDARAREKDLTRSKYLNQLLVGWSNADPRNPRLDAAGRRVETAPEPLQYQLARPLVFAERWQRFVTAHNAIFGHPPPAGWFEDLDNSNNGPASSSKE